MTATLRKIELVLIAAIATFSAACGNSRTYTPYISGVTAPSGVSGLIGPQSVAAGTRSIIVSGGFFDSTTVVLWNGKAQLTHFVSAGQLNADLDSGLTDSSTTAAVTARSDGTPSSPSFSVNVVESVLQLTAVAPTSVPLGAAPTTLTVTGSGFRPSDVVLWNGKTLQTTFQSETTLSAVASAAILAIPGDGFVRVSDPACTAPPLCTPITTELSVVVGTSTRQKIDTFFALDVAADATDGLLLVSSLGDFENTLVFAFDPDTFKALQETAQGPAHTRVVISDGDQFLYTYGSFDTSPPSTVEPQRYPLPALSAPTTLASSATQSLFVSTGFQTVAPAPGAPITVAVLNTDVHVVDDTTGRPNSLNATGIRAIEWGFDSSALYGLSSTGLIRFGVDASGITSRTALGSTTFRFSNRLHYDRLTRRLYGDLGENVDEQGADPKPFPVVEFRTRDCTAAIDSALGKAFYACNDDDIGLVVKSFDLATQQLIANVVLGPSTLNSTVRLVRFGPDGLALVDDGALYLYRGAFVH
jgi:hypothetical protein